MQYFKRFLAYVHKFFATKVFSRVKAIDVPMYATEVKTPIGMLDLRTYDRSITSESITWYGLRQVITYWKYNDSLVLSCGVYQIL